MLKSLSLMVCLPAFFMPVAFAGVTVSTPANGASITGAAPYVASATTSCSKGIGSMGIYSAPGVLVYVSNGAKLNTSLNLNPGKYDTVVEAWDNCGGASTEPITITINGGGGSSGVTVNSPANNATVGSPVNFNASAHTSCPKGVSSMGIYIAPGVLAYVTNGASLNYNLRRRDRRDRCGLPGTRPLEPRGTGGDRKGAGVLLRLAGSGEDGKRGAADA
jgi:hypothetical protein